MTGYRIENKKDRLNAFSDDAEQHFDSLEEARGWADEFWDGILKSIGEDEYPDKNDYIVAYYLEGVQRGEWPLFKS